jgi:hypothetical protein
MIPGAIIGGAVGFFVGEKAETGQTDKEILIFHILPATFKPPGISAGELRSTNGTCGQSAPATWPQRCTNPLPIDSVMQYLFARQ